MANVRLSLGSRGDARVDVTFALIGPIRSGFFVPGRVLSTPALQNSAYEAVSAVFNEPVGDLAVVPALEDERWESLRDYGRNRWFPPVLLRLRQLANLPTLSLADKWKDVDLRLTCAEVELMPHGAGAFRVSGTLGMWPEASAEQVGLLLDQIARPAFTWLAEPVDALLQRVVDALNNWYDAHPARCGLKPVGGTPRPTGLGGWAHRVFWFRCPDTATCSPEDTIDLFGSPLSASSSLGAGRHMTVDMGRSHLITAATDGPASAAWEASCDIIALQEAWQLLFMDMGRDLFVEATGGQSQPARNRHLGSSHQATSSTMVTAYERSRQLLSVVTEEQRYFDTERVVVWSLVDRVWQADQQRTAVARAASEVHELYQRHRDRLVQRIFMVFTVASIATFAIALIDFASQQTQPLYAGAGSLLLLLDVLAVIVALRVTSH